MSDSSDRSIEDLVKRFQYHPPKTEVRRMAHQIVRDGCLEIAKKLNSTLPSGYEKSAAMMKVEEAMFWANAALARTPDEGDS